MYVKMNDPNNIMFKNDPQTVGELTMVSVGYEGKSSGKTSSFGGSLGSKKLMCQILSQNNSKSLENLRKSLEE